MITTRSSRNSPDSLNCNGWQSSPVVSRFQDECAWRMSFISCWRTVASAAIVCDIYIYIYICACIYIYIYIYIKLDKNYSTLCMATWGLFCIPVNFISEYTVLWQGGSCLRKLALTCREHSNYFASQALLSLRLSFQNPKP